MLPPLHRERLSTVFGLRSLPSPEDASRSAFSVAHRDAGAEVSSTAGDPYEPRFKALLHVMRSGGF